MDMKPAVSPHNSISQGKLHGPNALLATFESRSCPCPPALPDLAEGFVLCGDRSLAGRALAFLIGRAGQILVRGAGRILAFEAASQILVVVGAGWLFPGWVSVVLGAG